MNKSLLPLLGLLVAGCAGTPIAEEQAARRQVAEVARVYRPDEAKPALPVLSDGASATDYVRFALLNHPQVEATYYDWRKAVEAITPARSLPDPQLTFQAYITHTITSLMPGFMADFTTAGKRAAMGREASTASEVARRQFRAAAIEVAAEVRRAWVELAYIDEVLALHHHMAAGVEQSLEIAQAEYATGGSQESLEAQTRFLNQAAEHVSDIATHTDHLSAARARFKAALGLRREDPDPPWPAHPLPTEPLPPADALWQEVLAANPELGSMRAMVEMAVAQVDLARRARTVDFTGGVSVDVKANPLLYWPTATMTLPIWRDKIAAINAAADANRRASESRLSAKQVAMAADLARMVAMARQADRTIGFLEGQALPNLARAQSSAEAGYSSGRGGFAALAELGLMQLDLRLELAAARRDRDLARTDLAALTAEALPLGGSFAESSPLDPFRP